MEKHHLHFGNRGDSIMGAVPCCCKVSGESGIGTGRMASSYCESTFSVIKSRIWLNHESFSHMNCRASLPLCGNL